MFHEFSCNGQAVEVSKLVYDLALAYAKTKLECALSKDPEQFENMPADPETEAKEFLFDSFCSAYAYYTGLGARDIERTIARFN